MNKLTKQQQSEKQAILDELTATKQKASEALDELLTVFEKAKEFVGDIHSEMDSYFEDKSEKWQEGDNGQQYDSWRTQWDEAAEALEPTDLPNLDQAQEAIDAFDNLAPDPRSV